MSTSSCSSSSSSRLPHSSPAVSSPTIPKAYQLSNNEKTIYIKKRQIHELQIAAQKQSFFFHAGIGAGAAFAWAMIEPESFLGGVAALVSGCVIGPFLGKGILLCEGNAFIPLLGGSALLERLPKDLYHHLARFQAPEELAQMPLSQTLKYLTLTSRAKIKTLDLTDYHLAGENLQKVLSLHPNITSLTLAGKSNLAGKEVLGPLLKLKPLINLKLKLPNLRPEQGEDTSRMWQKFLENLDLSKMNCLVCPEIRNPLAGSFWAKLGPKFLSSSLKYVDLIGGLENLSHQNAKMFLQSLPKTIVILNLRLIDLTNELIDIILEKFNLEAMRSCELHFSAQVDGEKVQKLLEDLPLSKMAQIELSDKGENPCLTPGIIQQIAGKLAKNKQLKILSITPNSPEVTTDSFILVIQSLRSPVLKSLDLNFLRNEEDFHKFMLIKYLLIQQSILYNSNLGSVVEIISNQIPLLESINENQKLPLSEARALFQAQDSLLAEIAEAGENVPEELRQKQLQLLNLDSQLCNQPMPVILNHYAKLHNILDPDNEIESETVLEHYGQISNPAENLFNLSTSDLIRKLEKLHQIEEQRLENAAEAMQPLNQDRHNRIQAGLWDLHNSYQAQN